MKNMNRRKKDLVYLNRAQFKLANLAPNSATVILSRRGGKTKGMVPVTFRRNIEQMPGGTHGIVGRSYNQILSKILPNALATLKDWGYRQNEHYFIGREAPKSKGFLEPKVKPLVWDYAVHWYNGSVNMLISQDVRFSANSLTLSSLIADEARSLDAYKLEDEVIAALTPVFPECPWDMSQYYFSDLPRRSSEKFLFDHKRKHDPELFKLLEDAIVRIAKGMNVHANRKHRDFFRKNAWLYMVSDVFENLEIVGEDYIKTKFRDMHLSTFIAQILTQDVRDIRGLFYSELKEEHYYIANDNSVINNMVRGDYGDIDVTGYDSFTWKKDADLDQSIPLLISCDTNNNQNWLIVGQADFDRGTHKTVNSFFVKSPNLLPDVIKDFCTYYDTYPNKSVCFYYDHTLKQGRGAMSSEAYYQVVVRLLTQKGWNVTEIYIGHALTHKDRHLLISQALRGENHQYNVRGRTVKYLRPTFNKENNEVLIDGLEQVGTKKNAKGWGKDKSREKYPDSEEDPVELRTDSSEAWDMLFIGSILFPWPEHFSQFSFGSAVY